MQDIEIFKQRFREIEKEIAESKLFEIGKKAFLEEIANEELSVAEKLQANASFVAQVVTNSISIAADTALKLGISYEDERSKKESIYHQSELAKEQINKLSLEKELIKSQIDISNKQISIEYTKLESAKYDVDIKLKQLEAMKAQVLSEIEKIKILNKTADDNLRIKVAELLVQFMQIALSKDWVKLDNGGGSLYTHILEHIEGILTKSKNVAIDTTKLDKVIVDTLDKQANINIPQMNNTNTENYNILVSNYTPNTNEIVTLCALSSNNKVKPKFYIDNKLIFSGYVTNYTFNEARDYELRVDFNESVSKNCLISVR